jgi:hypothetical protein
MINFSTIKHILYTVGLLLLFSCSSPTAFFSPDQLAIWKSDPEGCKNLRLDVLKSLEGNLDNLKGKSETEIKKIFGKPEIIDLGKRSEKFYFYHLEPSDKCENKKFGLKKMLSVRFNAINRVNEIIITQK